MGTYRLRVPASRVGYVPDAQGGSPPGPHVLYVRGARTSLGRWVRTASRGNPGETHDIGLAAVYLASAAGGYVNAETLVVDGGHWHDASRAFWQGREFLRERTQQRRSKL